MHLLLPTLTLALLQPVLGTLAGGNTAVLEPASVQRSANEVTAVLRTTFTTPAKVPGGAWYGIRTKVAVRCKAGTAAVLENRYYSDPAFTKVANEKIVGKPGYAVPVPGSAQALAFAHFCKR